MAVAAADFYTYAKATGTPLPKSKQEEANLAPAVNQWKKSRLKAPERERDSGTGANVLGPGAIAAGLAGAALYGYRRGWGKAADVAADVGKEGATSNIVRNLPNVDNVTGLADTTFIPSPITPQDSRGVKLVGTKNKQTGTYRASVNEIQKEPQVQTEFQNQAAADRDWDLAYIKGREDGLSDADAVLNAKRTVGQPIRKDYSPGPETEHRQHLSTLKTSSPINPRSYIENEGYVDAALAKVKGDAYADELTRQELDSLRGIDRVVKDIKEEDIQNKLLKQAETKKQSRGMKIAPDGTVYDPTTGMTQDDIEWNAGIGKYDNTVDIDPSTGMAWDDIHRNAGIEDTLVEQQKTIGPELTEQTLESANSGYEQMDDAFDRSVQRDTDSIAVGSQAVEVEKTQQALLQDAKLKAAAAIENRRLQLEQDTNLDPRSTRFDNALAREWATKPNVDPSIGSEDFRKTVQAPKDVEDFISTEIPETDASNVARNYYNQDTGNIQFATEDGGSPLIRDIYKEKVLSSKDVSKAASGGTIRGQSRSLDIQEPQRRTRTDEFTGDVRPDRIGGTLPTGGVPVEIDGQPAIISGPSKIEEANLRDAGLYPKVLDKTQYPNPQMAPQLSKQEVIQSIINPSPVSREDLTGGGAGMGVYGRQLGYVAGPESKTVTGLRSTGLRAKPTDVPETKTGREFNPQTKRDEFRDLSNDALRNIISRGTYRNNKQGRTAREAQYELKLRKDLSGGEWERSNAKNYVPSTEKAKKSLEISRDIQNIYNSGRPDAQQQVQAYIQGLRQGQQF